MKVILGVFMGILAVVIVLVLVAGYFGFVPGLDKVFGADKPVDLGVTYTQANLQNGLKKGNIQHVDLPASTSVAQSLTYSGQQASNTSLTDEEATALVNETPWIYSPVHDVQIRFNADGSAEFSAILDLDKLQDYAIARGYTRDQFKLVLDRVGNYAVIQNSMPIYMKGTASVINGVMNFNVSNAKLGRLSLPVSQINDNKSALLDLALEGITRIPGFSVKNFSISDGQMHFEGTLPQTVQRAVANK